MPDPGLPDEPPGLPHRAYLARRRGQPAPREGEASAMKYDPATGVDVGAPLYSWVLSSSGPRAP